MMASTIAGDRHASRITRLTYDALIFSPAASGTGIESPSATAANTGPALFPRGADWMGLFASAGTPPGVVARLHAAASKAAAAPDFARSLASAASEPWLGSSDDLRTFLAADTARWAVIVKEAGVQPD